MPVFGEHFWDWPRLWLITTDHWHRVSVWGTFAIGAIVTVFLLSVCYSLRIPCVFSCEMICRHLTNSKECIVWRSNSYERWDWGGLKRTVVRCAAAIWTALADHSSPLCSCRGDPICGSLWLRGEDWGWPQLQEGGAVPDPQQHVSVKTSTWQHGGWWVWLPNCWFLSCWDLMDVAGPLFNRC